MGTAPKPLASAAGTVSNVKVLVTAAVGVVCGLFVAGVYWNQLSGKIETAYQLATRHEAELKEMRPEVQAALRIKKDLKEWGPIAASYKEPAVSGPWGGKTNGPSMCPDGYYMVGVRTSSNDAPPYCIGCLNGAQAICRPINVKD